MDCSICVLQTTIRSWNGVQPPEYGPKIAGSSSDESPGLIRKRRRRSRPNTVAQVNPVW